MTVSADRSIRTPTTHSGPNGLGSTGWGGRLADIVQSAYNGAGQYPPVVDDGGCGPFCTGAQNSAGSGAIARPSRSHRVGSNAARQQGMQQLSSFDKKLGFLS